MRRSVRVLLIVSAFIISSCGVPQADYDKLKEENAKLKAEIEEYKYGEEKLLAKIESAYANKDYNSVELNAVVLFDKFPETGRRNDIEKMLAKIEKEEAEKAYKKKQAELKAKKKAEAEAKEKSRLAKLNDLGIWTVRYYVDSFGEKTDNAYVTNARHIRGKFSNTATENSKLDIDFLVSEPSRLYIQLYEYASNNPVKSYSKDVYTVLIQDKEGNRVEASAVNTSDRLKFDYIWSSEITKILKKGGTVKFRIIEDDTPTTKYSFDVNADGYDNALKKLSKP